MAKAYIAQAISLEKLLIDPPKQYTVTDMASWYKEQHTAACFLSSAVQSQLPTICTIHITNVPYKIIQVLICVGYEKQVAFAAAVHTIWLQIFVVENFCFFCNYTVIMKILFTKFSFQLIILDTMGAR